MEVRNKEDLGDRLSTLDSCSTQSDLSSINSAELIGFTAALERSFNSHECNSREETKN